MPEPTLPDVLRRRLSAFEQNVLLFAASGGPAIVALELDGVKTRAHAEEVIARTKAKAARVLQESIEDDKGDDVGVTTSVAELRGMEREGGWPHTNGVARRQVVVDGSDAGATKRRREGVPAAGAIVPDGPSTDGVPAEEAGMLLQDAGAGEGRLSDAEPPAAPPAPESDLPDEPSPSERESPARAPGRSRALKRELALAEVREAGSIRQADLRDRLGIKSPEMAGIARWLSEQPGVSVGPSVSRSPVFSWEDPDLPAPAPAKVAPVEDASEPVDAVVVDVRAARGLLRSCEEARRAHERLAREVADLAVDMCEQVPSVLLRERYLAALLKRIDEGDTDQGLLDRFERLAGFDEV